jgi:hypothetical protein
MKTRARLCRFQVKLLSYGNAYYIDRIAELESALRRKPKALQLEMIGDGEIPAERRCFPGHSFRKKRTSASGQVNPEKITRAGGWRVRTSFEAAQAPARPLFRAHSN